VKISVIIPTLNAGASIRKLLSSLGSQDIGPPEITVIDSSSDDDTVDIAKGLGAKTLVIPRSAFNHGKTRNMASMDAKGDILVFMTQDALPADSTLLSKLTAPLKKPDIAATFGRHIPGDDASPLEVFLRHFNYPERGSVKGFDDIKRYGIRTFFSSNVCSAIRKRLFLEVGMFPEGVRANEDMLITGKLILEGYKVAYIPEAMVVHSHNYSLSEQFRRYYDIGSSIKNNSWIRQYTKAEAEGAKFLKGQISFVLKQGRYFWLPYIFLESAAKYAGYRIGLMTG
jgi:rhamnosyltransferase